MEDVFQFVKQLLGTADAEGWNEHRAVIDLGLFNDALQPLATTAPAFVQVIAVGAFNHQIVRARPTLGRDFSALIQPTVDQQAVLGIHLQLVE